MGNFHDNTDAILGAIFFASAVVNIVRFALEEIRRRRETKRKSGVALPRKSHHKKLTRRARMSRGKAELQRKEVERKKRDTRRRAKAMKAKPYHSLRLKRGLVKALDAEVSLAVRESNPACVLCGESDWQKLTCGHLFKRTYEPTRFDTHEGGNCNTLCKTCNGKDNEDHGPYVDWFKDKHGVEVYAELEARANSGRRFEPYELAAMLEDLRAERRKKAA